MLSILSTTYVDSASRNISISSIAASLGTTKQRDVSPQSKKIKDVLNLLLKNGVFLPALDYVSSILHECGHASVAKIANPACSPHIHINPGGLPKEAENGIKTPNPLCFSIGNMHFHKGWPGLLPIQCVVLFDQNGKLIKDPSSLRAYVPFLVAGGLVQMLVLYIGLFANTFKFEDTMPKSILQTIKNTFSPYKTLLQKKGLSKIEMISELIFITNIISSIAAYFVYTLLPTADLTDGTKMWVHLLGKNNNQEICYTVCGISLAALWIISICKAVKTYKNYFKNAEKQCNPDDVHLGGIPSSAQSEFNAA
jgi:hypothetical protein